MCDNSVELTKEEQVELAWAEFNKRPKSPTLAELRDQLVEAQNNKCHYCSVVMTRKDSAVTRPTDATLDHKLAKCFGGSDELENLVASCSECNNKKGNIDYDVFKSQIERRTACIFTRFV